VGWFKKVDVLEYLESWFKEADNAIHAKRRNGWFRASHTVFVTFEKMSSAVRAIWYNPAMYCSFVSSASK
jgi:hypothetical protein